MQGRILGSIIFLARVLPSLSIVVKDHPQVQSETRIETCSPLKNHQTYSSVEVAIGSPPQYFNLVADTGSNSCIVKDCGCKQCPKAWGKCFTGPKKSSSFDLPLFKVRNSSKSPSLKQGEMAPAAIVMSFGSGQIAAQIASDEVRIGEVRTYMEKGLLLMVDHALNLEGPFEGILGLGRPEVKESKENLKKRREDPSSMMTVPGFFDSAHVQRFSMCFNHQADGVLGVNTPQQLNRMSSFGKLHWGLDFQGISIGNKKTKVGFCDPSTKKPGMETACGIIPDSGTTLIAGSEKHIGELFQSVCENWERCTTMHRELLKELKMLEKAGITISGGSESNPLGLLHEDPEFLSTLVARRFEKGPLKPLHPGAGKMEFSKQSPGSPGDQSVSQKGFDLPPALTLQLLLEHCAGWIKEVDLNKEMPELIFHVAGANGETKELVITPRNYVLAKAMNIEVPSVSNVYGIPLKTKKIQNQKVCMMAFSPTEYTTELNGDVWIMGTPLFYEYSAHYDRGDGLEKEVTMGFTHRSHEDCGRCQGHKIVRSHSLIWSDSTRTNSSTSIGTGMDALKSLDKQPVTRKPVSRKSM